jgi:phosphoenolpyruvate carboxykinase (ATP)
MPNKVNNVPSEVLDPKNVWTDRAAYDVAAHELALRFRENFAQFTSASDDIRDAGPQG